MNAHLNIFLVVLACAASNASYLTRMETKTVDTNGAQMNNLGSIDVEVYNVDGDHCFISNLDSSGNNFQQGEIDVFEGSDLEVRPPFASAFLSGHQS